MLLACRFYSKEPHLAGGDRQRQLAFKLAETWRGYEFDEVEIPKYKVLLSYPEENNPNTISVVSENGTSVKNFTEQLKVFDFPSFKKILIFVSVCQLIDVVLSNYRPDNISVSVK